MFPLLKSIWRFLFFFFTWRLGSACVKRSASFHRKQIIKIVSRRFYFLYLRSLAAFVCRCPLGSIRPIPENKTDTPAMILLVPLSHNSFNDIGSSGRTAATSIRSLPFRHVPPFLFFPPFLFHFLSYRVFLCRFFDFCVIYDRQSFVCGPNLIFLPICFYQRRKWARDVVAVGFYCTRNSQK